VVDFDAPLSDAKAYDLIAGLGSLAGATVVDYGCGWAELLLRALEGEPTARGVGVDLDRHALDRARANAVARGMAAHVRLEHADMTRWDAPRADVAISIASSQAWGGTGRALDALAQRLRPGGRLLFGDTFWERPPTDAALATADAWGSLADLVDLARAAGFRLVSLATANQDEWDARESRRPDEQRDRWLRGYRGCLGFAYLTLVRV
jgi:SAM-dependent methyltransferase